MFTQTIGNLDPLLQQQASQSSSSSADQSSDQVETDFLDYMKESPMQRMIDAWLKTHNLTEAELEKMPPEKRDAIEKQMANDIKSEIERETANKTSSSSASASASSIAAASNTVQSSALSSSMLSVFFGGSGSTDTSSSLGQTSDKDKLDARGL